MPTEIAAGRLSAIGVSEATSDFEISVPSGLSPNAIIAYGIDYYSGGSVNLTGQSVDDGTNVTVANLSATSGREGGYAGYVHGMASGTRTISLTWGSAFGTGTFDSKEFAYVIWDDVDLSDVIDAISGWTEQGFISGNVTKSLTTTRDNSAGMRFAHDFLDEDNNAATISGWTRIGLASSFTSAFRIESLGSAGSKSSIWQPGPAGGGGSQLTDLFIAIKDVPRLSAGAVLVVPNKQIVGAGTIGAGGLSAGATLAIPQKAIVGSGTIGPDISAGSTLIIPSKAIVGAGTIGPDLAAGATLSILGKQIVGAGTIGPDLAAGATLSIPQKVVVGSGLIDTGLTAGAILAIPAKQIAGAGVIDPGVSAGAILSIPAKTIIGAGVVGATITAGATLTIPAKALVGSGTITETIAAGAVLEIPAKVLQGAGVIDPGLEGGAILQIPAKEIVGAGVVFGPSAGATLTIPAKELIGSGLILEGLVAGAVLELSGLTIVGAGIVGDAPSSAPTLIVSNIEDVMIVETTRTDSDIVSNMTNDKAI